MAVPAPTTTTTSTPNGMPSVMPDLMATSSPTAPSGRGASTSGSAPRPAGPARRAGLSEQAAVTAIEAACRTLHLPTIRDRAPEAITAAERGRHTYAALLAELLLAECDARDERRRARRVHEAGFPRPKRLEDFDTDANLGIHPATLAMLATGDWVAKGTPVCLLGDSGTGKSHLLIGLGTAAAEAGHRVRYVLASRLVNELAEADNDRELTRVIARYGRVDLLCIDELGYLQLDRRGAELLFQVLTEREERNAIAIATNEPFSGWTKTFTDPRLCAAIVDRLTFNGHILETGTTSYRLAHTRATRGTDA
jgi:DNA replication protein DnaC